MTGDRDMSRWLETYGDVSGLLVEIEEFNQFLRNDPISRFILAALLASRGPVGGEKLYGMVKEAVEGAKRRGEPVDGVTRASFYRRLRMLERLGYIVALGRGRRRGPYTVRPSVREQFTRLAVDSQLGVLEKIEEELSREACKMVKAVEEGRWVDAYLSLARIEQYFESEAKWLLALMLGELLYIKELREKNPSKYTEEDAKLKWALDTLESAPEDLRDTLIQLSIAKALYITTPLYLIQTPLKALYKAIIKEECK